MRVFTTGGTGLIGSAVVAELLAHDHQVLALARSERSAAALERAGAEVLRGSLGDLDVLRRGATEADAVAHLAFDHDFSSVEVIQAAAAEEEAALGAIAEVLRGTGKPFAVVSGTPQTGSRPSVETDETPVMEGPLASRGRAVGALLADPELHAVAVRLPRTVHHRGEGGFAGVLTAIAREAGVAGYPGDGTQRWPAVHALDAASLFRLVLESAPAGSAWHAVADEGDEVRDLMAVVGRRLGLPVESRPLESFGPLGPIFATDQPSSSAHTREVLGWEPVNPSLLDDLENLQP